MRYLGAAMQYDPPSRDAPRDPPNRLADRVERGLSVPVLVAALASVPALFLTVLGEGVLAEAGHALNLLAGLVLTGETVLLLVLAKDRLAWVRAHRWTIAVTGLTLLALVFLLGPVQLLRMVRAVGALRILRIKRIISAGRIIRRRLNLGRGWASVVVGATSVLAALFAVVVLSDPTSPVRSLAAALMERGTLTQLGQGWTGLALSVLGAAVLFVSALVLLLSRRSHRNTS